MKKTVVLLPLILILFSCKKDAQESESYTDKIERKAYEELTGTWLLIDGLCEGGCAWVKPDLSIDNFLTIKKDRTYEYKRDKDISKGTFVFRYDVRCGSSRSDSTILFVPTGSSGNKLQPSKDEMMFASSVSLKNDTLTLVSPDCMVDGHGYRIYKKRY